MGGNDQRYCDYPLGGNQQLRCRDDLTLFSLPQPHPGAATVLGDELDAGGFKGHLNAPHGVEASPYRLCASGFHVADCIDADTGEFCKLRLFKSRKRPSRL